MKADLVCIPNSVFKVLHHQSIAPLKIEPLKIEPVKLLEISKNIKSSDILCSIPACKKVL